MSPRPLTRHEADLLATICACGECAADPLAWTCESAKDPRAVGEALQACRRLGIDCGRGPDLPPSKLFPTTDAEAQGGLFS